MQKQFRGLFITKMSDLLDFPFYTRPIPPKEWKEEIDFIRSGQRRNSPYRHIAPKGWTTFMKNLRLKLYLESLTEEEKKNMEEQKLVLEATRKEGTTMKNLTLVEPWTSVIVRPGNMNNKVCFG